MKRMLLILTAAAVMLSACNALHGTESETADRIAESETVGVTSGDSPSDGDGEAASNKASDSESASKDNASDFESSDDSESSRGDVSDASAVYAVYTDDTRRIPTEHEDAVAKILLSDGWVGATADCMNDFSITLDGVKYRYHSECGTINVFGDERSKRLDDAEQLVLNLILAEAFDDYKAVLSEMGVFPNDVVYGDGFMTVDLDRDGDAETLQQSFSTERNAWERGDLHYYTLEATVDGEAVTVFERCEWIPMQESDFCAFIVDVNADGVFEVAVLACGGTGSDSLSVYSVDTDGAKLLQLYTLA